MRALAIELGERGIVTSEVSVWRLVRDARLSFKNVWPAEQGRESSAWPLKNPHFSGGLAVRSHRRPMRIGRPNQRPKSFPAYIKQFLVPTLSPGDIVIMDNLGSHKSPAARKAMRDAGAKLLFLPPYSPDLNPIEQVFAKLKTLLRKAAERTVEAIWKRIGTLLKAFKPEECANYLRNSGYASN